MQVITDMLTTLKTQRDTIDAEVTAERASVEQKIADRVAELAELNAVIRAIERQQCTSTTATETRAPRGVNRDKILAVIAREPRTSREISDTTGIGRGSADRTLKQLEDTGEARRTANGWLATTATK